MGTRLIIESADFSLNGISLKTKYYDTINLLEQGYELSTVVIRTDEGNKTYGWFSQDANSAIIGMPVNEITFGCYNAIVGSTYNLYKWNGISTDEPIIISEIMLSNEDIDNKKATLKLETPIILKTGEFLGIGGTTSQDRCPNVIKKELVEGSEGDSYTVQIKNTDEDGYRMTTNSAYILPISVAYI